MEGEEFYKNKEEIEKIVEKIRGIEFDNLKKTKHYDISLAEKNTNEEELRQYFREFHRIKLVGYRKRASGYNNYDFYYEMDDGTFIIYSVNIERSPPELINAFHADKSFKNFVKSLARRYGRI